MELSARSTTNVRPANKEDLPRILELSRMWPDIFIAESLAAIEADFSEHHCCVYEHNGVVEAFAIFCTTWYEIEMLWGASNRRRFQRSLFLVALTRWIETTYFEAEDHYRIMSVKMASQDSSIPHAPQFSGMASTGIQNLLKRLDYRIVSKIDSFWFPGDHCVVAIKTKHQNE